MATTDGPVEYHFPMLREHGTLVVIPPAEIDTLNWDRVDEAARSVEQALAEGPERRMIMDLSQVQYFGSVFISLLIRVWKGCDSDPARFAVCGVKGPIREVLSIARLDSLWYLHDDRASAQAGLEAAAAEKSEKSEAPQ